MNKPKLEVIEPKYVYVAIPKEYICVYHRLLVMLADYGEEMLKDCKAACTDRNSGIVECFNMFNAAVAAYKLDNLKLASLIINYVKAKINQIYKNADNSTSFVFPVDDNGQIKAFVSCGETPVLRIDEKDMTLYKHKYGTGFDEHFRLGDEDGYLEDIVDENGNVVVRDTMNMLSHSKKGLDIIIMPYFEKEPDGTYKPCADISIAYAGERINIEDTVYQLYFDFKEVKKYEDVAELDTGLHVFGIVVTYKDETKIVSEELIYGGN